MSDWDEPATEQVAGNTQFQRTHRLAVQTEREERGQWPFLHDDRGRRETKQRPAREAYRNSPVEL